LLTPRASSGFVRLTIGEHHAVYGFGGFNGNAAGRYIVGNVGNGAKQGVAHTAAAVPTQVEGIVLASREHTPTDGSGCAGQGSGVGFKPGRGLVICRAAVQHIIVGSSGYASGQTIAHGKLGPLA